MRLNIEDADFNDSRLRVAVAMAEQIKIVLRIDNAILGVLSRLWYYAINEQKRQVSIKQIGRYLLIFDPAELSKVIDILVASEYLEITEDGQYRILGKDKDFDFKAACAERAEVGRRAYLKKIKPDSVDESRQNVTHLRGKGIEMYSNSVENGSSTTSSTTSCKRSMSTSHYITDHSKDLNTNTITPEVRIDTGNKATIPASKPRVKKETAVCRIRDKYKELWARNNRGTEFDGWGSAHNGVVTRLLRSYSEDAVLKYLGYYFDWQHPAVIVAGWPLYEGYNSFLFKLPELKSDIANLERRGQASMAKQVLQGVEKKASSDQRALEMLTAIQKASEESLI